MKYSYQDMLRHINEIDEILASGKLTMGDDEASDLVEMFLGITSFYTTWVASNQPMIWN